MNHLRIIATATATAAAFVLGTAAVTTAPAQADTQTNALIGAFAGAVVGSLLFDNNRNQYYYVSGGHRRYVNRDQAAQWYQHRDPGYYNAHRSTFQSRPDQFSHDWNDHHGRH